MESDSDNESNAPEEKKKEFRFNAKKLYLTYAQAEAIPSKRTILEFFKQHHGDNILTYLICEELHQDGKKHYHAYFKFHKKLDTRNVRAFDINGIHPNIKAVKKGEDHVIQYIMKGGNYEGNVTEASLYPTANNFVKKRQDFQAWSRYMQEAKRLPVSYPVKLPNVDMWIQKPDASHRQRHWVIQGPPGCGKTQWINTAFANMKVYLVPTDAPETMWEGYENEDIIIFDDFPFHKHHIEEAIIDMTNTWALRKQIPGKHRYYNKFYLPNSTRTVLIVCNDIPEFVFQPRFSTRFNILNWDNPPSTPIVDWEI